MNKKLILLLVTIGLSLSCVFGQIALDPSHEFYESAQNWRIRGLVDKVPPLRPYTKNCIEEILNQVIENGNEKDKALAQVYLYELKGKNMFLEVETDVTEKIEENFDFKKPVIELYPTMYGSIDLVKDLNIAYQLGFALVSEDGHYLNLPTYKNYLHDAFFDPGKIGPLYMITDMNSSLSYGNTSFFGQMGLNRIGYGEFLDKGICLNDTAYHSGNFTVSYIKDKWEYVQNLGVITGTSNYDGSSSDYCATLFPEKFISFHHFSHRINKNYWYTYYESSVFGQKFDPSYFIPVPYMIVQSLSGFNDNIQMGFSTNWIITKGLLWTVDVFVDDASFNDIMKLNFNSKQRIAGQTGIKYAPSKSFIESASLVYTAITPYTYAHWDYNDTEYFYTESMGNYQNYTHAGVCIGSNLPPNSQALQFSLKARPTNNLSLSWDGLFAVHGNAIENITDDEAALYLLNTTKLSTNGSIFTTPCASNTWIGSSWTYLNFLNQEHLMYVAQTEVKGKLNIPVKYGRLSLHANVLGEAVFNKGVDSNIYTDYCVDKQLSSNTFVTSGNIKTTTTVYTYKMSNDSSSNSYTYEQTTIIKTNVNTNQLVSKSTTYKNYNGDVITPTEIIQAGSYKESWINQFRNVFSTYITIGLTYTF